MPEIQLLLDNNVKWAEQIDEEKPDFFDKLSKQQKPKYLWIGCADSRVPANDIVGLLPGELFVHRNVANMVVHTDLNCLSVLQYAVDVLEVKHIIVCGHYGCGGITAALKGEPLGLIDNWLGHIQDVASKYAHELEGLEGEAKDDRMCELNVREQALNVLRTSIVKSAKAAGKDIQVHSFIYSIKNGRLKKLGQDMTLPA
ncbi:carbonate dehydratase [Planctobacterium marinum]|uniref:Carbonic anhydrase n=1 Tax=Planctobacterium marinum TaxID=1631968 RepID=A0AA48KWL0_9ALTE|nr:carbonic anhydrase [Planctobacterium marinum]